MALPPLRLLVLALCSSCGGTFVGDDGDEGEGGPEGEGAFCEARCLGMSEAMAELGEASGFTFDAEAWAESCAALEPADCDACWLELSALAVETYEVYVDCWCSVPESKREPEEEELYACDELIEEYYESEAAFRAGCACD